MLKDGRDLWMSTLELADDRKAFVDTLAWSSSFGLAFGGKNDKKLAALTRCFNFRGFEYHRSCIRTSEQVFLLHFYSYTYHCLNQPLLLNSDPLSSPYCGRARVGQARQPAEVVASYYEY